MLKTRLIVFLEYISGISFEKLSRYSAGPCYVFNTTIKVIILKKQNKMSYCFKAQIRELVFVILETYLTT